MVINNLFAAVAIIGGIYLIDGDHAITGGVLFVVGLFFITIFQADGDKENHGS